MGENVCDNCNCEFDIDIMNAEYHLYQVQYCPNCGSPLESEELYD